MMQLRLRWLLRFFFKIFINILCMKYDLVENPRNLGNIINKFKGYRVSNLKTNYVYLILNE